MNQRRQVPVEQVFAEWGREPAFREAYEALADEFALASALIRARDAANMTQAEVAAAMGTTQAAVARLEGGRGMPTTRTLARFAKATGTHLRFRFEPSGDAAKR